MMRWWTRLTGDPLIYDMSREVRDKTKSAVRKTLKKVPPLIRQGVRERYTYKGAIKTRTKINGLEGTVTVSGSRNTLRHFQVRGGKKPRKLFAMVVRGQGGTIARGFKHGAVYYQRVGRARLPIKGLRGPSTAEMAGHEPEPATLIQQRIGQLLDAELGAMM